MSDEYAFEPGDVVQLRSGGPLLTVTLMSNRFVEVIYFNATTGLFARFETPQACLKAANQAPQTPDNTGHLRNSPVRSSL